MDFARDARNDHHTVAGVLKLFLQVRAPRRPAFLRPRRIWKIPCSPPSSTARGLRQSVRAALRMHLLSPTPATSDDEEVLVNCLRRISNLLPPGNKAIFLRLLQFCSAVRFI